MKRCIGCSFIPCVFFIGSAVRQPWNPSNLCWNSWTSGSFHLGFASCRFFPWRSKRRRAFAPNEQWMVQTNQPRCQTLTTAKTRASSGQNNACTYKNNTIVSLILKPGLGTGRMSPLTITTSLTVCYRAPCLRLAIILPSMYRTCPWPWKSGHSSIQLPSLLVPDKHSHKVTVRWIDKIILFFHSFVSPDTTHTLFSQSFVREIIIFSGISVFAAFFVSLLYNWRTRVSSWNNLPSENP